MLKITELVGIIQGWKKSIFKEEESIFKNFCDSQKCRNIPRNVVTGFNRKWKELI